MRNLSKCCKAKLIKIDGLVYCNKCGLVYHKVQNKLKPEEELDECE